MYVYVKTFFNQCTFFKGWLQATFRSHFHQRKCEVMKLVAVRSDSRPCVWVAGIAALALGLQDTVSQFTVLYFS